MATIKFKTDSPYSNTKEKNIVRLIEDQVYVQNVTDTICAGSAVSNQRFGIAIYGMGRAGTIHLRNLLYNPRVVVLYIVDNDKTKWHNIREYWKLNDNIKILSSENDDIIFADKNVNAVVVASPTYTHEEIVVKALKHKKGVFCEKPIAENIEKSRKCYEIAKEVNLPLLAAFNRRFDKAYNSIKERVRSGEVGHVNTIKVCSRDSPLPSLEYLKISGGIFHDCAVHDIDMIVWILGEYPTKVSVAATANIPEIKEIGDYDTVGIVMTFPSGTVGMIDLSRFCNYGYDQRLEVFGYKGMLKADNQQITQNVDYFTNNKSTTGEICFSFSSRYEKAYQEEMEHFLSVLGGQQQLKIDPRDTLAVSKIASACEESARTGKTVDLEWNPEELPFI